MFELDGNRSNTYLFNGLKARLQQHNVQRPVIPIQLIDPDNENEEIPEEVDTEELILKLNRYRRDPNKSGGGTQLLHAPPTAHMVQSIFSFAVAVDTLGRYNWRHHGDFSISTFNPLKGPNLDQNLRKKSFKITVPDWGL